MKFLSAAHAFSILVDETKDFAKQEQMSFVVRFADMSKGEIHEHFLTHVEAKSLDATSLSTYIKELLIKFNLDFSHLVSQGYDGASVMSGSVQVYKPKYESLPPVPYTSTVTHMC